MSNVKTVSEAPWLRNKPPSYEVTVTTDAETVSMFRVMKKLQNKKPCEYGGLMVVAPRGSCLYSFDVSVFSPRGC